MSQKSHRETSPKHLSLEEQRKVIGDLIGFKNQHLKEYHEFVTTCARQNTGPCLLKEDFFHLSTIRYLGIDNLIAGKPLVDLGGGSVDATWSIANWAEKNGASVYIDVDRCLTICDEDSKYDSYGQWRDVRTMDNDRLGPLVIVEAEQKFSMPTIYIADDILDFLARLESGFANISISGIGDEVVGNKELNIFIANEIARIISEGGVVFGSNTEALYEHMPRKMGIKMIGNREDPSHSDMIAFVNEDYLDKLSADARNNLRKTMYEKHGKIVER